jgi:DNA polymerase III gamma/tau subunit
VREIQDGGIEVSVFLEQLQEHYQSLLKACYGIEEGNEETKAFYREFKSFYQTNELLFILNRLDESLQNLKLSHHPRLHLEMTLLHLMQKPWKCTIDHLMARLDQMKDELLNPNNRSLSSSRATNIVSSKDSNQNQQISEISPLKKEISPVLPSEKKVTEEAPIKKKEVNEEPIEQLPSNKKNTPNSKEDSTPSSITTSSKPVIKAAATTSSPSTPATAEPSVAMAPGTFEGLIQFAARELGGHLR